MKSSARLLTLRLTLACAAVTILSACAAAPTPPPTQTPAPTAIPTPLTLDETRLKNAAYTLPDLGTVQLSDGKFEQAAGSGATQVTRVDLVTTAVGDLNGDGTPDAAALLALNTGGSGTFIILTTLLNQNGQLIPAGSAALGDRSQVQQLSVEGGLIRVNYLRSAPTDPMCCPSEKVQATYRLDQNTLSLVSESLPGQ